MKVNEIKIALRLRSAWEAVDLGFGVTRLWWSTLVFCWLLTALPVAILSVVLFPHQPEISTTIIWWCKPLYEQLPLFFISRAVFGEIPTRKELRQNLFRCAKKQLFANLTWRRFSMNRSFTASVHQLEGLSGHRRRERIRVLSTGRNTGSWLTIGCVHFEGIIYISLMVLLWMLVPNEIEISEWLAAHKAVVNIGTNILYLITIATIAPFYVVSGFVLYLNRRTELEGWDIELAFRRIANRLSESGRGKPFASAAVLLVAILLFPAIPSVSEASQPSSDGTQTEMTSSDSSQPPALPGSKLITRDKAGQLIHQVLQDKDFGETHKVTRWRLRDFKKKKNDNQPLPSLMLGAFMEMIADIGYYLLWLLVALLIVLLLYQLPKWRKAMGKGSPMKKQLKVAAPDVAFGLDVTESSLPDNIDAESWRLFQDDQPRAALSLLYRGSLSRLIHYYDIELRDSDTEGQCARRVAELQSVANNLPVYFTSLTQAWIRMAYGHFPPSREDMQNLCEQWQVIFNSSQQMPASQQVVVGDGSRHG